PPRLRSRPPARVDGRHASRGRVRLVHPEGPARVAPDGPLDLERGPPLPAVGRPPRQRSRVGRGHLVLPPRPRRVRRAESALRGRPPDLRRPRRLALRGRLRHRRRGRAARVRPRRRRAPARGRGHRDADRAQRGRRHGAAPPRLPRAMSYFRTARPVWPEGRATEMNQHVGFRAVLPPIEVGPVVLHVAASSVYRVHVGGDFVGHGPARGPHGRFRVDAWDLTEHLGDGDTLVAVEVVGYNVNSYYLLDQPAFLLAEVRAGDAVLASTAGAGIRFEATLLHDHVQRVERYSVARTFSEAFRLGPESYR